MIVGVIGSGTMGAGIAQVAATAGCGVILFDADAQALERSRTNLEKILNRLIEKGKYTEAKKAEIIGRISYVEKIHEMANANLVIEAIVENPEIKKSVFETVEGLVSDECVIASNTSSLSITSLAAVLKRPERFIGIHFFNPAPLMKLVEIVPAIQTSTEVMQHAKEVIGNWGKLTVIAKDTPGFIVNRVARPFYSEAIRIYEEGIAGIATIDWAMKEIGGFRMGPFELMDFIGHDVNYTVSETVFKSFFYDVRYRPSFTQKRLVEANYLGRKSGKGFYDYENPSTDPIPDKNRELGSKIVQRIVVRLINEAADACYLNIASKEDIDLAMTAGVNYPKGPLAWADDWGLAHCVNMLDDLYDQYHEGQYRCTVLLRKMVERNESFFN